MFVFIFSRTHFYSFILCIRKYMRIIWWVIGDLPLTAAGKGLANFSMYSASFLAWSFPLNIMDTAPYKVYTNIALYYFTRGSLWLCIPSLRTLKTFDPEGLIHFISWPSDWSPLSNAINQIWKVSHCSFLTIFEILMSRLLSDSNFYLMSELLKEMETFTLNW